jgi:GNAT superfamily N-acetyltransferase
MKATLAVRPATRADLQTICDFNASLALESEGKTLEPATLRAGTDAFLRDPSKGRYYVAEMDGDIVGQIGLTFEWSDWRNGWFWWVQSVYVRPDARRGGVFRALYQHLEGEAQRDPQVIGIRLYVDDDNGGAQETYRRLGLTPTTYRVMERYPLGE